MKQRIYYYENQVGEIVAYETREEVQANHNPEHDGQIVHAPVVDLIAEMARHLLRYRMLCELDAPHINELINEEIVDERNDLIGDDLMN